MKIIDAHSHLWLSQDAIVDGHRINGLPNGRAMFFGEVRQMLPPFMMDGVNSAEVFLSNMNYAQVSAAVVVQEVIDGNQNKYLLEVAGRYPDRFLCCGMPDFEQSMAAQADILYNAGFRAAALPAHRMSGALDSADRMAFFKRMEELGMILSICLSDDLQQIGQMRRVIAACPALKVAVGHFGMVTGQHWHEQIRLAEAENVYVESGGITWLYNSEFYPYPTAIKSIREAAEMVGMNKLMWGSDYPRTICAITYRMSYDFILKSDELSESEKEQFLGGNAAAFYGFGELVDLPYIKNMSE